MLNRTLYPQRKDYFHLRVLLLLLSLLTSYNLLPFLLLFEPLDSRSLFHAVHAPDPNGNYAVCTDSQVKIIITETDLRMPDNTRENISLDWRELWNFLVSTFICIIGWERKTLPGKYSSGINTDKSQLPRTRSSLSATCCAAPNYNSKFTAIT